MGECRSWGSAHRTQTLHGAPGRLNLSGGSKRQGEKEIRKEENVAALLQESALIAVGVAKLD